MNKSLSIESLLLVCLLMFGCGGKTTNSEFLTLDLESAIDNQQIFDLAGISDDIDFIALDSGSKESLLDEIKIIAESETGFYIKEIDMQKSAPVKMFDMEGKFTGTRGRVGRGPGEFIVVDFMAVDYETDNLYLHTFAGGELSLLAYDSAGKFFARESASLGNRNLTFFEDKVILLKRSSYNSNGISTLGTKVPLLELLSYDLQPEGTIDVIEKGSGRRSVFVESSSPSGMGLMYGMSAQGIMSNNGKTITVKEERNDTVFYYRNGNLEPAYILDLGNYALPEDAYGRNPEVSPGDSYSIQNILEGDRYVFVAMFGYKDGNEVDGHWRPYTQIIFDKINLQGGFFAVGPDKKPGLFIGEVMFTPMYIRDNRLVGYMQALDIVDNRNTITNPKLKALASILKEDSNPVIVVATLRSESYFVR